MLKIRLSMGGVRKRPVYKIVIADSRYPRDGKFIEKIGSYNPLLPKDKKERIKVEAERVKYWMSKGAQPTLRVSRILGEAQIMPMPKPGNNPQKAVPKRRKKEERKQRRSKKKLKRKNLKQKRKRKNLKQKRKRKNLKQKRKRKNLKQKRKRKNLKQKRKRKNLKQKRKRKNLKQKRKRKNLKLNSKVVKNVGSKNFYFISRFISWSS